MRLLLLPLVSAILTAANPPAQFREHTIANDLKGGYQVVAVDLNHDGKPDLIALASGMKDLVWFENPGWQRHVLYSGLSRMINCAVLDTGEIAVAHEFANQAKDSIGIVSLLKPGTDPLQPWTATEIDRLPTSHRLRIADIDGSGSKSLINAPLTGASAQAPEYRGHTPLVFYRPGEWKRQMISDENEGVVHGIYVTDWDGDGHDEILTASFTGIHLFKRGADGKWTRTEIAKGDPSSWPKGGSSDVAVGTLRKKRFLCAIEPWHGNQVVVYRQAKRGWERGVIDDRLVDGHTILTADLNDDRLDEIVAGFRGKGRSVYIYSAADDKGEHWTRSVLDNGGIAAAACTALDLNGDGRTDIACIGSATANLKWYENVRW